MKTIQILRNLSFAVFTGGLLFSCDPNDGLEKYEGTWIHEKNNKNLPADTLIITNLGNGNASVKGRITKLSNSIFSKEDYKVVSNSLTGTYNPENERIDMPTGQPIIYNPETDKLTLVESEWTKLD